MEVPLMRRLFRISVDVEVTLTVSPDEISEHVQFYQTLMQRLLVQPTLLDQFLQDRAVDALTEAQKEFAAG